MTERNYFFLLPSLFLVILWCFFLCYANYYNHEAQSSQNVFLIGMVHLETSRGIVAISGVPEILFEMITKTFS